MAKAKDKTATDEQVRVARVDLLVPEHARENYTAHVQNLAEQAGISVDEARAEQVRVWREQHATSPLEGFGVLADWLEGANLDEPVRRREQHEMDPDVVAHVKAVEAAKHERDLPIDEFSDDEQAEILRYRGNTREAVTEKLGE